MNLYPGEIWLADLGLTAKTRPVLIVSRYDPDPPRNLIIYIPLTTQYRASLYEVALPRLRFLNQQSYVNVQGLGSIDRGRLERRLGKLSDHVMTEIKNTITFVLDLETDSTDRTLIR